VSARRSRAVALGTGAGGVALAVLAPLACVASQSPDLPPPIGTPADGSVTLPDVSQADVAGPCPGSGTVNVTFDRGEASQTCWSGYSPLAVRGGRLAAGQPIVALSGNPQSYPGLALDGPCVLVTAEYEASDGVAEWKAFGGTAVALDGGVGAGAVGALVIESANTAYGQLFSVSFSAGSSLVLDAPSRPLVGISGSASAPVQ
jgi:hypothetical protein